jgi:hypothetical protein
MISYADCQWESEGFLLSIFAVFYVTHLDFFALQERSQCHYTI